MKKLPKIYQGDFNKKISNNKNSCYLDLDEEKSLRTTVTDDNVNILETITEVFTGLGHAYNVPLIIKTKDKTYETSLIAKTKKHIVTLDNISIPLEDIISIKKNIWFLVYSFFT